MFVLLLLSGRYFRITAEKYRRSEAEIVPFTSHEEKQGWTVLNPIHFIGNGTREDDMASIMLYRL